MVKVKPIIPPRFYLAGVKGAKYYSIRCVIYAHGFRIKKHTGHKVMMHEWDKRRQRATFENQHYDIINRDLDDIITRTKQIDNEFIRAGVVPSKSEFYEKLFTESKLSEFDFYGSFEKYISKKELLISEGAVKAWRSLLSRLKKFNPELLTFDKDKLVQFERWALQSKYGSNLIIKNIGMIKEFMAATGNPITYKTSIKRQKFDAIALNESELQKIWEAKVPDYIENAKIRFLLMCYTGMRLGDSRRFSSSNVVDISGSLCIKFVQQKSRGGKKCIIPVNLHPILGQCISLGYRVTSDDKFRQYLKKLCEAAGLVDSVEHSVEKGGKRTIQYTPKYQLVMPHTARRSFVTNMIFRGHSYHEIASMSGHSTMEIMEIYNKVKGEDNAVKLSKLYSQNKKP